MKILLKYFYGIQTEIQGGNNLQTFRSEYCASTHTQLNNFQIECSKDIIYIIHSLSKVPYNVKQSINFDRKIFKTLCKNAIDGENIQAKDFNMPKLMKRGSKYTHNHTFVNFTCVFLSTLTSVGCHYLLKRVIL